MRRTSAALGSATFLVLAPGTVAGIGPWLITGWHRTPTTIPGAVLTVLGILVVTSGVGLLIVQFARFAAQGHGTPAPVAPTDTLVCTGAYRWVRNPMYVAVVAIIIGQSILCASVWLLVYAVVVAATMAAFVRTYEEPTLRARYGSAYEGYTAEVPRWIPKRPRPRKT
jgi:protein-S-isoprenylcysteine O-methyltransferase Ste14